MTVYFINHLNKTGINNKSPTTALNKVILIRIPIVTLGGCMEVSITKKPKNKMILVRQIALPVS